MLRITKGIGIGRIGTNASPLVVLMKDYYGHKGKGYATEVVITAKKLPPDGLKDVEDDLGEAQNQQDNNKETKSRRQSQEGS